jgi:myo-inositol-1(or 4)-monophosphatase
MDGYWEQQLNPWDVLAGILIVREAGGIVTDYDGGANPQHEDKGKYVASNAHLHVAMLEVIQTTRNNR